MPRTRTLRALAKALIGLAWEDGQVTAAELNLLKDVTFQLPEMTASDWQDLEIYWITPIGEPERHHLFQELLATLQTEDDLAYARQIFRNMVMLDGTVTPQEAAALHEVERALERLDESLQRALSKLMDSILQERSDVVSKTSHGEGDAALRNRVYDLMKQRFGENLHTQLGLDEVEIRRLSLAGALMARIAYVDREVSDEELVTMDRILQQEWSLYEEHARLVVDCAVDAVNYALDNYRLVREFYEVTLPHERADFLNILFRVARSHEGVSQAEFDEIQRVAQALKISAEDFALAHRQK